MTQSIPISLLEGWITEMTSYLKNASPKTETDLLINQGMRQGLRQIGHRIKTWVLHQENLETLSRSGKKLLKTKDVNLSHGNYRKLEWYENDQFLTLAWRHGKDEAVGELMLEVQDTRDLSKTYLVYKGGSSFDDLAALARKGGLDSIRNEANRGEWVEDI